MKLLGSVAGGRPGNHVLLSALVVALVLSGGPPAQATTVDFEAFDPGTVLSFHPTLEPLGVRFPRGVEVVTCHEIAGCGTARSGANAAVARSINEFRRDSFVVDFTSAQQVVTLHVKGRSFSPPRQITARLQAFDALGFPVGGTTVNFESDGGWTRMSVVSLPGPRIRQVVLTGGSIGEEGSNFLVVDDLTFEGDPPPPPPDDGQPPAVRILAPADGATVTDLPVRLSVRATDDRRLMRVDGRIIREATGAIAQRFEICGTASSALCPPTVVEETRTVDLAEDAYLIAARACDTAGNCGNATTRLRVDLPEPPPDIPVRAPWVEVNQGVQSRVFDDVPLPGGASDVHSEVPIVPGKDTVVRYYVLGQGGTRSDFSTDLQLHVQRLDGSSFTRVIGPNAGTPSITAPADPVDPAARRELLLRMRADLSRTLNYVVPGRDLADARRIELKLGRFRLFTGGVQLTLHRRVRLGLNVVRLFGPGAPGSLGGDVASVVNGRIVNYLRTAYPVSEVRILSTNGLPVMTGGPLDPFMSDCDHALYQLWATYGTDDAPARFSTSDPSYTVTLGVAPFGSMSDALGCAYIGDPDDDDDRIGAPAIAEPWGDTAAQEVAHGMGLIHAGNAHGESGGGDAERWPHPHGTVGPGNFGVIPVPVTTPGPSDSGQWTLSLVDPCPTADLSRRLPTCVVPDGPPTGGPHQIHDFMSYGVNADPVGSPFVTSKGRWVSDITYRRIYHAIRDRAEPITFGEASIRRPLEGTRAGASDRLVEAILIYAAVPAKGPARLAPVVRKRVPRSLVDAHKGGPYRLELRDSRGRLLRRRSFALERTTSHTSHQRLIRQVVPFIPGVKRLTVKRYGKAILRRVASRHAPRVRALLPSRHDARRSGRLAIRWRASDQDGDRLTFLVQYSRDGGRHWQAVAMRRSGLPYKAGLDVPKLARGSRVIIRVTASDGLNSAADAATLRMPRKRPPSIRRR